MTRSERLRVLGADAVAAIRARAARCPVPPPGSLEPIRDIFASPARRAGAAETERPAA